MILCFPFKLSEAQAEDFDAVQLDGWLDGWLDGRLYGIGEVSVAICTQAVYQAQRA